MKIAVNCLHDEIAVSYGASADFMVFEVERGAVRQMTRRSFTGSVQETAAEELARHEVDLLICGTLSLDAEKALVTAGVLFVRNCSGSPRTAVERYLDGTLPMGN